MLGQKGFWDQQPNNEQPNNLSWAKPAGGSLEGEEKRKTTSASAAYETAMREHPLDVTEAIARTVYGQLFAAKN